MEIFDPENNVWIFGPDMKYPRRSGACLVLDGMIYAIGGNEGTLTIECFDLEANAWKEIKASLPLSSNLASVALINSRKALKGLE